jgi:MFS family permease
MITMVPMQVPRRWLVLFGAGLLFWISLSAFLPTLPLYVQDLGGSPNDIGMVMASFAVGLLLSRTWLGQIGERWGYKAVLALGMGSLVVAPLGYGLFPLIPVIMLMRGIQGISIAAFATGYMALVANWAEPARRGRVIGIMSLVNPIGMSLGPVVGESLRLQVGYGWLFAVMGGIAALGMLVIGAMPEDPHPLRQGRSLPLWGLLKEARIRIPTVVMFFVGLAFGTLIIFVAVFMRAMGSSLNAGWFYGVAAVASFGMRFVAGQGSDRWGRGVWISLCLLLGIVSLLLLSGASQDWQFLLAGALQGAGFGLMIPMFTALVADRSYPHERAVLLNLCTGGFDAGIAIAGPVAGALAEAVGYRATFLWAAGMGGVALVVFVLRGNPSYKGSLKFALGQAADGYALTEPPS